MTGEESTPRTQLRTIGPWTLGRTLGRGAYAHVRLATHTSGHQAACKILPALHRARSTSISHDELMDAVEAYKEVVLLKALAGAGIKGVVGLEGVIQRNGWTYIFLALHNASASHIKKRLKAGELILFFRQLLRTVHALHLLSVSHEDIKRSNILFNKNGAPVLVDFGFSHFKADGGKVKSAGGTLDYSSPEKVQDTLEDRKKRSERRDTTYDPKASDVWSLGILLIKLLGRPHPYMLGDKDENSDRVRDQILYGRPRYSWTKEELRSGGFAELVMGMLDKDPRSRLTIPEIANHPALQLQNYTRAPWRQPTPRTPKKLSHIVLLDVAFLAYLNDEFYLCESFLKIEEKILGSEACWEKQWASFLYRWKGIPELELKADAKGVRKDSPSTPTKIVGRPLRLIQLSSNIPGAAAPPPSRLPIPSYKIPSGFVNRPAPLIAPKPGPYVGPKPGAHVKNTHISINTPRRQKEGKKQEFARSRQALVKTNRMPAVGSPTLATLGSATRNALPMYSTGGLVSTAPSAAGSEYDESEEEDDVLYSPLRVRGTRPFPRLSQTVNTHSSTEAGPSVYGNGRRVVQDDSKPLNKKSMSGYE